MKYFYLVLILSYIFVPNVYGGPCDDPLKNYLNSLPEQVLDNNAFLDLDKIVKKGFENDKKSKFDYVVVLDKEPNEKSQLIGLNKDKIMTDFFENPENLAEKYNTEVVKILGLTEKEALILSGDPYGRNACSQKHLQGDLANRWCHGAAVYAASKFLQRTYEMNDKLANILAATIFLPKEYIMDDKPSMSDLVITKFPIYENKKSQTKVNVTVFGDGMFYINFEKKF